MLTQADYRIRDYIVEYITEHGYSPSIREIADSTGYKSSSTVQTHMHCVV